MLHSQAGRGPRLPPGACGVPVRLGSAGEVKGGHREEGGSRRSVPSSLRSLLCQSSPTPQIRVKRTSTVPEFDFAYTDPSLDVDVSSHMERTGGVELGITKVKAEGGMRGGAGWMQCMAPRYPLIWLRDLACGVDHHPRRSAQTCAPCRPRSSTTSSREGATSPRGGDLSLSMSGPTLAGSVFSLQPWVAGKTMGDRWEDNLIEDTRVDRLRTGSSPILLDHRRC